MDITIKRSNPDIIGFEDEVTLKMTRLEAHKVHAEMGELDLWGVSPEFVELAEKLKKIVDSSKKDSKHE